MARRPNYNQQRADVNRAKQAKAEAKQREREAAAARRKAERDGEGEGDSLEQRPAEDDRPA